MAVDLAEPSHRMGWANTDNTSLNTVWRREVKETEEEGVYKGFHPHLSLELSVSLQTPSAPQLTEHID